MQYFYHLQKKKKHFPLQPSSQHLKTGEYTCSAQFLSSSSHINSLQTMLLPKYSIKTALAELSNDIHNVNPCSSSYLTEQPLTWLNSISPWNIFLPWLPGHHIFPKASSQYLDCLLLIAQPSNVEVFPGFLALELFFPKFACIYLHLSIHCDSYSSHVMVTRSPQISVV